MTAHSTPPVDSCPLRATLQRQRQAYLQAGPPAMTARIAALRRLQHLLREQQSAFIAAVSQDFGHRSAHETMLGEIFLILESIQHTIRHLPHWMRPQQRRVPLHLWPATAQVRVEPLGVVGIMSPWNYPLSLALMPLVAALAAGNRVMLKPSEYTPASSALLQQVLSAAFDADQVSVVTGDAQVGAVFAGLPFDHLFFTGSTATGRLIMRAASEHLVPVTLELGGKSPVLMDEPCALEQAVQRIARGKLFNAGQTCIAPDYVLLRPGQVDSFVDLYRQAVGRLYPGLVANPDYTSVVNERHYARLQALVEDARRQGARVVEIDPRSEHPQGQAQRKFVPTLLLDVNWDMQVMQEEIFGPILPLITYTHLEQALAWINARHKPLALYYFGTDRSRQNTLLARTSAGGVTINDTLLHCLVENLPFGGVGASGMGAYHGQDGFMTFSHRKPVVWQARWSGAALAQPPYGKMVDRLIALLIRK